MFLRIETLFVQQFVVSHCQPCHGMRCTDFQAENDLEAQNSIGEAFDLVQQGRSGLAVDQGTQTPLLQLLHNNIKNCTSTVQG